MHADLDQNLQRRAGRPRNLATASGIAWSSAYVPRDARLMIHAEIVPRRTLGAPDPPTPLGWFITAHRSRPIHCPRRATPAHELAHDDCECVDGHKFLQRTRLT
jgi:hypothetical protein